MPAYADERCTECGKICSKILLTSKRVQFVGLDNPKKVLKSRVKDWLCEACLAKDPDWNLEAYEAAPSHKSPGLERVREAQRREANDSRNLATGSP